MWQQSGQPLYQLRFFRNTPAPDIVHLASKGNLTNDSRSMQDVQSSSCTTLHEVLNNNKKVQKHSIMGECYL